MSALVLAAAVLYRVVPLACSGDRLAVSGGAVLQLAAGSSCALVVPGRPLAIAIDADGRAAPQQTAGAETRPAAEIPRSAFVLAPASERSTDQTELVTVVIDVEVPARTPTGDDVYLSTERSGWSPSEVRMDRVDARHFRLTLRLRHGARLAFRLTRGSVATLERDRARALPPAHLATGEPNGHVSVSVPAWADID